MLAVLGPAGGAAVYLWAVAADQYASRVGFYVRREEAASAVELLGGLASLSGAGASDSDVLFEYIQSQPLVQAVDARLDLRAIYAIPGDPVFALGKSAGIEDLTRYWRRMVRLSYDRGSGMIEIRVQAFSAPGAQAVARAVFDEASAMINGLSGIARADAMRLSEEDLARAVDRLKAARQALTAFRARTRIVDPAADIAGRMGILADLEGQLTEARVELDLLRETTRPGDPRIRQAERMTAALQARIAEERARFASGDAESGEGDYAALVAEYEGLSVDLEFAEQTYLATLAARDAARAEAGRQSRYLAAYVPPTLAETPEYPRRWVILGLVAGFAFLAWAIAALGFYSLRDRR